MKKIILFFVLSGILYSQTLQADFGVVASGNTPYDNTLVKIEAVSLVFEGINNYQHSWRIYNRYNDPGEIYNGFMHRLFDSYTTFTDYPLEEHSQSMTGTNSNIIDMGHCGGRELPGIALAWGFAKYKVTIKVANEKYVCYMNCLDSRYGTEGWQNHERYIADIKIRYDRDRPQNYRVVLEATLIGTTFTVIDSVATWDTLSNGEPSKEFKVWKMLYNRTEPWEKDFKARTTPFPINPNIIYETTNFRQLILGTTVTLDTVFDNLGNLDRYGYNTIINYMGTDYYTGPPIIPGNNDPGNTFCTPATANYTSGIYGMRITAATGDAIVIKDNK